MLSPHELKLIAELRQNARKNLTLISRNIRMPVSTIFDKLKKYENTLITKHCSLIDFSKLGYGTKATIILKVKREQRDDVREYLMNHFNINSLYRVNNGYDFMVEAVFRDIKDMEEFLEALEDTHTIKKKEVYYIINEIKREAFMSNPLVAEMMNPQKMPAANGP